MIIIKTTHDAKLAGLRAAGDNVGRAQANAMANNLPVAQGDAYLAAYYSELRRLNRKLPAQ